MVKENIKRLYKAMGLQKWLSGTQVNESVSIGRIESEPNSPNISNDKYISWLEEHPSALTSFHSMMKVNEGKQIIVFLDYDGTLAPIVDDPDHAFMSDPMRAAVREVAKHFPTAIISGRRRDKVYEFVKLDEIYYAGSHGMDIMGPPLHVKSYDDKFQSNIIDEMMLKDLKKRTCEVPGALVEDNGFCVSVHYRHVLNKDYDILEEIIQNVLSEYNCFHVTRGIKVIEIRPSIKWNKGDALVYLLDTFGFDGCKDVVPIYLGDDKTDEDAFKVLASKGQGYPIIVSSVPKETSASHSLRDPSEVLSFLLRLARLGEALH